MSARQNKKQRKGRGNVHQRERTVTTLTEDPNTHYLVPTPSEEPAGNPHMPLSFNNPKMHNVQMGSSFQMGTNYPYPGSYATFNPNIQQQQQQQPFFGPAQQQPLAQHQQPQPQSQSQPQQQSQSQPLKPTLPPGKNDLEILQNLKKIIKDGQHPYFRAVPQPAALASIYLGTISSQSQAQGRRGEVPGDSAEGQSTVGSPASANDAARRQPPRRPRMPSFASASSGGTLQANNNSFQASEAIQYSNATGASNLVTSLNLANLKIKSNPGPTRTSDLTTPTSGTRTPEANDLQRRYDYSAHSHDSPAIGERSGHSDSLYDKSSRDTPVIGERSGHGDSLYDKKAGSPDFLPVDDRRLSAATIDDRRGHPLHAPDYTPPDRAPGDPRPNPGDSRPQPDSRGEPESSGGPSVNSRSERGGSGVVPTSHASISDDRIVPPQPQTQPSAPVVPTGDVDDIQSSRASSLRPTDAVNQNLGLVPSPSEEAMVGGGRSDMPFEDNGPRPSLKDRLVPPRGSGRASSEHPSHYGDHPGPHSRRPKFYKDKGGGASFDGPPRPGVRGPSGFGAPPVNGGPMPGGGGQAPRSFHTHSPPPDGRGAKLLSSSPSVMHRHPIRGPPLGRPMGREDRGSYRTEYDPRRADVLDDAMVRYGDRSYRDFSPPLGEIPRGGGGGRPAPFPPSPGRAPPGGDGRRSEWPYQQYPPSPGVPQNWGVEEEWDRSGDRDRFERDVPPRSAGWDYRGERDFITRDGYSSGPPLDDRGYPNRDADRGRTPGPYTPTYGRVRPRSPSPIRRGLGSMDDSRPAMKRPREDFTPSGYYPPHVPPAGNRDGPLMRRPPAEYPPPPRSGSSGPPPGSAASWPTSGGSSTGGPPGDRDRDYRMGRDGMDFPPPAGYDRPRSPGPLGRHSYGRGGGGGGGYGRGDPRDRGGYGMPPRP